MALKQNNAEGQVSGTIISASQSGSGDSFAAVTVTAGSPTYVYDNSQAAHGTQSYHISGASGEVVRIDFSSSGVAASAARVYIYFAAMPSAATDLFQIRNTGGQQNASIGMNAGKLQVKETVNTLFTFANALTVNTWYRIELQTTVGTTTSNGIISAAYYVGDSTTPVETIYSTSTANTTATNASTFRFGKLTSTPTLNAYFDDLAWNYGSATAIGPYMAPPNQPPVASAGPGQENIEPYTTVTLSGTDSDTDGTVVSRQWTQVSGSPSVTITNATSATATYTAPGTLNGTSLVFGYAVVDDSGNNSTQSTVTHTILSATERAVIDGAEVPIATKVVQNGDLALSQIWTAENDSLVRRSGLADTFILGQTKPDASNTGVPSGTVLTPQTTVVNVTTAGATYENISFQNYVFVKAANVTFRNCEFIGPTGGSFYTDGSGNSGYGLVGCRDAAAQNVLIERCDVHPQNNTSMWWLVGVSVRSGSTVTINRCNIYHTVDGVNAGDANGSVVKMYGNYVHDLAFFNNSNDQASSTPAYWTHNDNLQLLGGSGHEAIGNNFWSYLAPVAGMTVNGQPVTTTEAGYTGGQNGVPSAPNAWGAGVTVSSDYSQVLNCTIKQNWYDGGAASFQMNALNNGVSGTNVGYLGENRFGMDQYNYDTSGATSNRYQIRYKNGNNFTGLTTNYFDPDNPSVPANMKGNYFSVGATTGIRVDP